jgi:hypothetical protein
MEGSPLRNVAQKAGPHGQVGKVEPVVLRDTARSSIVVNPWFIERSSGEIQTSLKFIYERKTAGPPQTRHANITLSPEEVIRLHEVLHDFLSLSGESEGDYIVVPVAADDRLDTEDTARKLAGVLRQPGVAVQLAALGLSADIASALHGAARVADLRAAVAELRDDLGGGLTLERVYQEWCDRHSWAFGNAYVARDEVRGIAIGDQVDLLMRSSESGLRDVFELKRPDMPVIGYDKSHKCWHWSQDTAKAIGQCHRYLDALHEAAQHGLRDHPEVVAYHPRAFIVVGRSAEWTEDQQRALHGLNMRMHAITVMTYDHLLARAEAMLAVLADPCS